MLAKDIQNELTVEGWGMWLRYCKHNNVPVINGIYPDDWYHEFTKVLDITEPEDLRLGSIEAYDHVQPVAVPREDQLT